MKSGQKKERNSCGLLVRTGKYLGGVQGISMLDTLESDF